MRLGHGVVVKESNGHEYGDVWRYEARGGRRVQVFEYAGSLRDPATERARRGVARPRENRATSFMAGAPIARPGVPWWEPRTRSRRASGR